jgi:hypothetical protein
VAQPGLQMLTLNIHLLDVWAIFIINKAQGLFTFAQMLYIFIVLNGFTHVKEHVYQVPLFKIVTN